ncbi:endolytic transglycosylase MltG [Spirulina major CS-329]|uniref:endolytic transglycosylase MltG n=1 Tax=Spirulina TaxID=1154 RepID=UPI00232ED269|nr:MULTISPECIES: endolytic transglycosylase MltG [Spirulina]MDB9496101.1 endolytic transglycosylase MltG [Spirulina subsalsa CS-330]MDB9503111.1 endolytic transglycosylase MltG [Spirulina major CS-329]
MKKLSSFSQWLYPLGILPGVLLLSGWHGYQWWRWAVSPVMIEAENQPVEIQVEVPADTSTRQIGADLEAAGVIHSAWAWNVWAFWLALQDQAGSFKAGQYVLSPGQDMTAIAQSIWTGQVFQSTLTIPEGWRLTDIAQALESQGLFPAETFLQAAQTVPTAEFTWLPADITTVEGFLYPDTYQLPPAGTTPQQVIAIMLKRFEQKALPLYQGQTDPGLSLVEWVTLASMVEKEAGVAAERGIIAGVFRQRLAQGMRLESDPTVEYVLGRRQTPDQPLTLADVQTPSPYNTYLNPGMPPGPIASPGQGSLAATLNPVATEYLFFVARYDGTHVFSRTLEEHEAAAQRIRAGRSLPSPPP